MVLTDKLRRSVTLAVAALLFMASLVPLLTRPKHANAYGLLPTRSITMKTSAASATSVTYHVRFDIPTPVTNTTLGSIAVDFCDNSPIIGDTTCSAIAGFDIGTPTVSGQSNGSNTDPLDSSVTGDCDISGLTTASALTTHTLSLVAPTTAATVSAGQTCFFDITTVSNPSTANHTFYARIYTYVDIDDDGNGCTTADDVSTCYTVADPRTFTDAGGIALSTAAQITVTAKVQERLTFCVYTFPVIAGVDTPANTTTDNTCSGKSGTDVFLGDENGVLSSTGPYVDKTAYFSITTNAAFNAVVRLKGGTLTNGGGQTVTAVGATPTASVTNTEQFGLCLYHYDTQGATLTVSDGTAAAPNNVDYTGTNGGNSCSSTSQTAKITGSATGGDGGSKFAFDTANTGAAGYGQIIATKPAGAFSTGRLAFIGNISDTTEPGIYQTVLTFIATGTY